MGKKPATIVVKIDSRLERFAPPSTNIKLDYKGLGVLIERGFTVAELAELFLLSRPSVYKMLRKERVVVHPGVTLYVNYRIAEVRERTGI